MVPEYAVSAPLAAVSALSESSVVAPGVYGPHHQHFFNVRLDMMVDGPLNHSCDPNCQAVIEESASGNPRKDRVLIEAIRNIKPGEELTYDYGITLDVPHTARLKKLWRCLCGSPKCSGTLLKAKS